MVKAHAIPERSKSNVKFVDDGNHRFVVREHKVYSYNGSGVCINGMTVCRDSCRVREEHGSNQSALDRDISKAIDYVITLSCTEILQADPKMNIANNSGRETPRSAGSLVICCHEFSFPTYPAHRQLYQGSDYSLLLGYSTSSLPTKSSFTALMLTKRLSKFALPALSLVPLARAPPNGCWPTTAPVHLQLM